MLHVAYRVEWCVNADTMVHFELTWLLSGVTSVKVVLFIECYLYFHDLFKCRLSYWANKVCFIDAHVLWFLLNRKYDQALEYHRQALVLIPQNASTYSAIGYVHSLMGDFESAIDYFHTVRPLKCLWPPESTSVMFLLQTSFFNAMQFFGSGLICLS